MLPWRHILLATDFSTCSEQATEAAIELAKKFSAKLTLVHVWELPVYTYSGQIFPFVDMLTPIEDAAKKALAKLLAGVQSRVPEAQALLLQGAPAHEIVNQIVPAHVDLVIIGTHGRRGVSHAMMGSVAERVVRMSPAPVLTVRV